MLPASRTSARARSARPQHDVPTARLEDDGLEEEGKEETAAHVLMSMSEAASGDLQDVEVEIFTPRGKNEVIKLRLSSAARCRLERHLRERPKRDHMKATTEVQQFDRPSKYIAFDHDSACQACRTAGWACSVPRETANGRPRPVDVLVGVRCTGCSAGGCIWSDGRAKWSHTEKEKVLEAWNLAQEGIMERRKTWFETGLGEPGDKRERSRSARPRQASVTTGETSAGKRTVSGLAATREEEEAGQDQARTLGAWTEDDTCRDVAPSVLRAITPEPVSTTSRKRKPADPPPDLPPGKSFTIPPTSSHPIAADRSASTIPVATSAVTVRPKKAKPAPKSGTPSENQLLISEHDLDEIQLDPDLPHYRIEPASHLLDKSGIHRALKAYLFCPAQSELSISLHPSVARLFPLLTREIDLGNGFLGPFSNLVERCQSEYLDTDSIGKPRITLPPYVYSSTGHKCWPCRVKRRNCYLGHVPVPTPDSIITGSIPLGTCISCLATGHDCVAVQSISAEKFPLTQWYGPFRASFLDFGSDRHAVSPVSARATSGPIKGDLADDGPLMISLVQKLRDETCRTQWQSVWTLLSMLADRLATLWPINRAAYIERVEDDDSTIGGTLLCSNEVSIILNRRDFRLDLESHETYPLDLAVALSVSAQSSNLSIVPRYIFPKPLSPHVVQESVPAHTGSARCMVAGLMISPSVKSSSQFRFGAWVIDPSAIDPTVYTFGIEADLKAFHDPVALFGCTRIQNWTLSHVPFDPIETEEASGPRATEFLRLWCTAPDDVTFDRLANSVLNIPHATIRKRHLTRYALDCESSKRLADHMKVMGDAELAAVVKIVERKVS